MDFGLCVQSKIDGVDVFVRAEELGFTHVWVADVPMIWSDCYAVLALAAQRTRTIRLGTGVAVAGLRPAPVTASSIATINRLAPGRTFLGLGTGNAGCRMMGRQPMGVRDFERYVQVVRALLRGEEADHADQGTTHPVRFDSVEWGFLGIEPRIPVYVSVFGPKIQALAGRLADGLVMGVTHAGSVRKAIANLAQGASAAGRSPGEFYNSNLAAVVVLEPGEPANSERVLAIAGANAATWLHYIYEQVCRGRMEPPPLVRPFWKEYTAMLEDTPAERRHQRVHQGHLTYLRREEARFLTPEVMRATSIVGTADEVVETLRAMGRAGLHQQIVIASLAARSRYLEDFARQIMPRL